MKYNRPGGTVVLECTSLAPNHTRLAIRDTGQGLSTGQLPQLFQPFNRLGQESSSEEGTGIGLVTSKLLVELMGGTIGVESTVGVGSLFWFDLNSTVAPSFVMEKSENLTVATVAVQAGHPVHTLLYIEDNKANLNLVEGIIARRPDLKLLSALNGDVGMTLARQHLPDVILMDINLPGLNGIQVLNLLRKDPLTARIPVVAISANAMLGDIKKGMDAGFLRYLTKPIILKEFIEAVDLALANGRD